MMPDLGKYAFEVIAAYASSIGLLVAIVAMSWQQARRQKAALDLAEGRRNV